MDSASHSLLPSCRIAFWPTAYSTTSMQRPDASSTSWWRRGFASQRRSVCLGRRFRLDSAVPHICVVPEDRDIKTDQSKREIPLMGVALMAMREQPDGFPRTQAGRGRPRHDRNWCEYDLHYPGSCKCLIGPNDTSCCAHRGLDTLGSREMTGPVNFTSFLNLRLLTPTKSLARTTQGAIDGAATNRDLGLTPDTPPDAIGRAERTVFRHALE